MLQLPPAFVDWIREERDVMAILQSQLGDEVSLRWKQGHVQVLSVLLDAIDNAQETIASRKKADTESDQAPWD
jgi:hypothetical protein